jgi:putative CocE/NonD family hydrolase
VQFRRSRNYKTDDQRFASRRPDVLTFQTAPLREDLSLAGPVGVDLSASVSTTDADFVVKLIDVFPDTLSYNDIDIYAEEDPAASYPMGGYQMLVRGEILRGRFRKGLDDPQPFTPGKVEEIRYAMPDVAHIFKKGHRLMIQIQSSWFPLVDRNPQRFTNIYTCDEADFQKAVIKVYHDENHPSSIVLPVLR